MGLLLLSSLLFISSSIATSASTTVIETTTIITPTGPTPAARVPPTSQITPAPLLPSKISQLQQPLDDLNDGSNPQLEKRWYSSYCNECESENPVWTPTTWCPPTTTYCNECESQNPVWTPTTLYTQGCCDECGECPTPTPVYYTSECCDECGECYPTPTPTPTPCCDECGECGTPTPTYTANVCDECYHTPITSPYGYYCSTVYENGPGLPTTASGSCGTILVLNAGAERTIGTRWMAGVVGAAVAAGVALIMV